jgi:hypothetical protein
MLWCPGAVLLEKLNVISLPENKNIKLPDKVYETGGVLSSVLNSIEKGKANIENIYSNGLPMYENITRFMLDNERNMREYLLETLYSFEKPEPVKNETSLKNPDNIDKQDSVPESTEPSPEATKPKVQYKAKRIGTDSFNAVWAFAEEDLPYSEGWTDKTLLASEDELRERLGTQARHVNRIANANHDVNFYVYVCTRFQETEIFGEIIKDIRAMRNEISTYHLMKEFFVRLDETAINNWDYFKIDTVEKRIERICKTDHHESAQGAYSIYCDVINMMAKDSPEIGEPRKAEFGVIPKLELRGSHVWGHGYTEIVDEWVYYKIDLPEHTMASNINGKGRTVRQLDKYLDGKFSKDTFADHYATFYPRPAYVEYPGNKTGRNLLMLTDSYSWATGELIASHFDKTYATLWTHGRFEYNEFIWENNITDVIILQVADRLLYDIQNDTQLDKVITN